MVLVSPGKVPDQAMTSSSSGNAVVFFQYRRSRGEERSLLGSTVKLLYTTASKAYSPSATKRHVVQAGEANSPLAGETGMMGMT